MKSPLLWMALTALLLTASCSKEEGGGSTNDTVAAGRESLPTREAVVADSQMATPMSKAQRDELIALVDLIVAEAEALPRASFDPAALAKQLGSDPQAHFEWVRDNTWWAPYRGLLRGSKGVLLDRVGSNLDRAVLLGDLLRHAGHTVRLAQAELPEAWARDLLAKLPPTPEQRVRTNPQVRMPLERQQEMYRIVPGLERMLGQERTESGNVATTAKALASSLAGDLNALIKGAIEDNAVREETAAISAMRDHWWIERENNGTWVPMDVLLPVGQRSGSLSSAESTYSWTAQEPLPAISNEDWHSVLVRLVVERMSEGGTTESIVLETELRPVQVLELPVTLMHLPTPWPTTLPDTMTDPNAVGNAAVNVREWLPVLQVGDEFIVQSGFTDSGNPIVDPIGAGRDIAETGGAGFMTGFGETLGGGDVSSSSMTAEWLEYEIRVPGQQLERIRRPIFDLLGAGRRTAGIDGFDASTNERLIQRYEALLSSTQIFLQSSNLTMDFFIHLAVKSIAANQREFQELTDERDATRAAELAVNMLDRLDNWGPLPILGLWRSELAGTTGASFIDKPNVLNYRIGIPAVNADRVTYREIIDIATNSTSPLWGASRSPIEIRLQQGVVDTVAEVLALGGDFNRVENTAAIFAMAGASQVSGKLVGSGESDSVKDLGWPEDVAQRLRQDIDSGFAAVVLDQSIMQNGRQRVGWWRIDPITGQTIGVMDSGFHGAMDERVEMELHIIQLRNSLQNWLRDRSKDIAAARARAKVPWDAAKPGDAELLRIADRLRDVLREAAMAGF